MNHSTASTVTTLTLALLAALCHPSARGQTLQGSIAHYDVAADGKAVHVLIGTGKKGDASIALWHVRSLDGGASWSKPVRVNGNADRLSAHHPGEDPAIAVSGERVVIAWTALAAGERRGGRIATAVSADGGATWQAGMTPFENPAGGQTFMRLAARGDQLHMVWLDSRTRRQSLRYATSTDGGASWGKAWQSDVGLVEQTCDCCWNRIMVTAAGAPAALYRGADPRDMMFIARGSDGRWNAPVSVDGLNWKFAGCPHVGGALAETPGALHALSWSGKEGSVGLYHAVSSDAAQHWRTQRLGGADARNADLATLANGTLAAVWSDSPGRGTQIFAAESKDAGKTWSTPQALSTDGAATDYPRVVAAGEGRLVFWYDGSPRRGARLVVNGAPMKLE